MPTEGDRATCKLCGEEIRFDGRAWCHDHLVRHTGDPDGPPAIVAELARVEEIVGRIHFPGYAFVVARFGNEHIALQVRYEEPDVMTGVPEEQLGRLWAFPAGQVTGQIVQTAFKAILTSLEHRAREHFTYRGKPVLQPHQDLDVLAGLLSDQPTHASQIPFAS